MTDALPVPLLGSLFAAPPRVAIVGSRGFAALHKVWECVALLPLDAVVVSGGARGVDRMAARAARFYRRELVEHLPDWETYGRGAGMRRNTTIAEGADQMVAFWDGVSTGTAHAMGVMRRLRKPVMVVRA